MKLVVCRASCYCKQLYEAQNEKAIFFAVLDIYLPQPPATMST